METIHSNSPEFGVIKLLITHALKMYQTSNKNRYPKQLKNMLLFIGGRKLEHSTRQLYIQLYNQADRRGRDLTIETTLAVLSEGTELNTEHLATLLNELKIRELFDEFELQNGKLFIKIKNLENYGCTKK